jgi:curved DNA-binding protein CbpA
MLFKDYYDILNVNIDSTFEEIKYSFRKLALRWHPDRNRGMDTTAKMQELTEAYLILKDIEARAKYDEQYHIYVKGKAEKDFLNKNENNSTEFNQNKSSRSSNEIIDDQLLNWILNAQKQAKDLAKISLIDLKAMAVVGGKSAINAMAIQAGGVLFLLVCILLVRSCS